MSAVNESTASSRYSRSGFLKRVGAGAGAVAFGGGVAGAFSRPVEARPAQSLFASTSAQTFGRLFPNLEPFAPVSNGVTKSLLALGAEGGLLDAQDQLSAGPIDLITNPALSVNNPDNPTHTAGTTFMGQFIDHDITFDTSSKLGVTTDPFTSPNGRTPSLDLDSVYGNGPAGSSALYNSKDPAKLLIASGGTYPDGTKSFEDLPRLHLSLKKALPFVVTADHNPANLALDRDQLARTVLPANRQLDLFHASASAITGQL